MEKESNISLGGTIILLTLFLQKYIFGQRYMLLKSSVHLDIQRACT